MKPQHRIRQSDGLDVWDVQWYPAPGARVKTKRFYNEDEALRWCREVMEKRGDGEVVAEPARRRDKHLTLGDWFIDHVQKSRMWADLAFNTREYKLSRWDNHICDEEHGISHRYLAELADDPSIIADFLDALAADGRGAPTRQKVHSDISALLREAVLKPRVSGIRGAHPMYGVVKAPSAKTEKPALPQTPTTIELLRWHIGFVHRTMDPLSNQLFISIGHKAGPRPQEIRALTYGLALGVEADPLNEADELHGNPHMTIRRAVKGDGQIGDLKAGEARYAPLIVPLEEEVRDHMRAKRRTLDDLIFPELLADHAWRNWRKRDFHDARSLTVGDERCTSRTLATARPYDVGRHSMASLRLRCGMWGDQARLARWLGHSVETLHKHYAGVIDTYTGTDPLDFVDEIVKAQRVARPLRAVSGA